MKTRPLILSLLASVAPLFAAAEPVLKFPDGSSRSFEAIEPLATARFPVGPFINDAVETASIDGAVQREVWKTPVGLVETLRIYAPLRDQVKADGYTVLFECETRSCGGFDFRFNTDVVAEPDMHVDLGDFRFLSAMKISGEAQDYISLLVSRSPERGFVQLVRAGSTAELLPSVSISTKQTPAVEGSLVEGSLADRLSAKGAVVLDGLEFAKGKSELSGESVASLTELAALLAADKHQIVVLVGHTDASGSLEGNVALSRKRALSVMNSLIETYGVNPDQVTAEGVGYLSPRASNATEEGRSLNRRVEVVLTKIE
jgi:OmpA-OmpF porin, OOP family